MSDESLRERGLQLLEKYSNMYTGTLGTIKATEHRINVKEGTVTISQRPYREGPKSRDVLKEHIQTQLDTVIIEPDQAEWATLVLLTPKKTEPCDSVYNSDT